MPLFTLATSKKGAGYLKHEALWEEVRRFVGITYTASKNDGLVTLPQSSHENNAYL
ncbi:hypothetical protein D3C71_1276960 [compost metagenome]